MSANPASIRRLIRDCRRTEADKHTPTEVSALLRDVVDTLEMYAKDIKRLSKEPHHADR